MTKKGESVGKEGTEDGNNVHFEQIVNAPHCLQILVHIRFFKGSFLPILNRHTMWHLLFV